MQPQACGPMRKSVLDKRVVERPKHQGPSNDRCAARLHSQLVHETNGLPRIALDPELVVPVEARRSVKVESHSLAWHEFRDRVANWAVAATCPYTERPVESHRWPLASRPEQVVSRCQRIDERPSERSICVDLECVFVEHLHCDSFTLGRRARPPNDKHQRARATASRGKDRSRCARSAACDSSATIALEGEPASSQEWERLNNSQERAERTTAEPQGHRDLELPMRATVAAERQASAGARDGVKGKGAISLRALRCMR